jgi:hypothetical protein
MGIRLLGSRPDCAPPQPCQNNRGQEVNTGLLDQTRLLQIGVRPAHLKEGPAGATLRNQPTNSPPKPPTDTPRQTTHANSAETHGMVHVIKPPPGRDANNRQADKQTCRQTRQNSTVVRAAWGTAHWNKGLGLSRCDTQPNFDLSQGELRAQPCMQGQDGRAC